MTGFLLLVALLLLLALGIPVAYALGLATLCYFVSTDVFLLLALPQRAFAGLNSYVLISLPFFILMGQVMNASGITSRLIQFSLIFVGRLPGGLGMVNVLASMLFGGISGSSASDTASIGSVMIPEMERRGYPPRYASGITVGSSTMGMIIPPSVPMVLYSVVAQESVGKLFLGGLIPGILVGVFQLGLAYLIAVRKGYPREAVPTGRGHAVRQTLRSLPVLLMPACVVGSVVFGVATATESAAIGVVMAIAIGFLLTRQLTLPGLWLCLRNAVLTSAKIMAIIAFSQAFIWVLALERTPEAIAVGVDSLGLSAVPLLMLIGVIILLAGTFIDVSPAILLLTPVFLPSLVEAGVSPVQFGVVLVSGLAVGACTPPVGNCLNVCSLISKLSIGEIFRGAAPFLVTNVVVMLLAILFPQVVLWIPSLFG